MKEISLAFGPNDGLIGTITLPEAEARDTGVVLLNAGTVHRVGPHRINVRLARQLAARGIPSIRFDLAGHGDSARLTGDYSFEEQAVVDIRAAMDALMDASEARQMAIFGICSGAYQGYAAALRDERVGGLVMFDAYRYPNMKTHIIHYAKAFGEPGLVPRVLRSATRGAIALGDRVRAMRASRPAANAAPLPGSASVFIPEKQAFAAGLKTLLDRGVRIHMLYSGDAPEQYNYANQFRDNFAAFGIGDRVRAEFLPHYDHQFSVMADQLDAIQRVTDWVGQLSSSRVRPRVETNRVPAIA